MNSSVRAKPLPPSADGQPAETRQEKLRRVREQVINGYYKKTEVLKDVADALLMNPEPFENLSQKQG